MSILPRIRLASASPRRSELLRQLRLAHDVAPVHIDESVRDGEHPDDYVLRMAWEKARAALATGGGLPVLAADTAVIAGERILGKPADEAAALEMLSALSGRSHEVLTSVALLAQDFEDARLVRSAVTFREITPDEARRYWATGEPCDKAGAYAIQGLGAVFVAKLEGSYSAVMGLPLHETAALLRAAGLPAWGEA